MSAPITLAELACLAVGIAGPPLVTLLVMYAGMWCVGRLRRQRRVFEDNSERG